MLDDIQTDALAFFTTIEGQMWDNMRRSIAAVDDEDTRGSMISWAANVMQDALDAAVNFNEEGDRQQVLQAHIVTYGIASIFRLAIHIWYVEEVDTGGEPRQYERKNTDGDQDRVGT